MSDVAAKAAIDAVGVALDRLIEVARTEAIGLGIKPPFPGQ